MKVLIGCEKSQVVAMAFRKKGHQAFSCDLLACTGGFPEYHIQGDVIDVIHGHDWDFIGLHPDCINVACSGNRHYAKTDLRTQAIEWIYNLWSLACRCSKKVYLENPVGVLNRDQRFPRCQIIQPYYFGDGFQKTTCLWLHGLPKLFHSKQVDLFCDKVSHVDKGEFVEVGLLKKKMPRWYSEAKNKKNYREIRSNTFPGIAEAMASQWVKMEFLQGSLFNDEI